MQVVNWYVKVLKQYADFHGRARRTEFWMYTLITVIISIVLSLIDRFAGLQLGNGSGILSSIYGLATLIPGLAVSARRLHDTDRTGWWILIGIIPVVGWIVLIVFDCLEGNRGPNSHGEDPKMVQPV